MKKIYFAGHNNFGNRGCEALIRSIVQLISSKYPDSKYYIPSFSPDLDGRQWIGFSNDGLEFVEASANPTNVLWWDRFRRILPFLEKLYRPKFRLSENIESRISQSDLVIMTGGDNLALDYGLGSLYNVASYADCAKRMGVPCILWGASVGPFSKKPHIERFMAEHLSGYSLITVRESKTEEYLNSLGLTNVKLVADPAFVLKPEIFECDQYLPRAEKGVVGFNLSPLVRKYREGEISKKQFDSECAEFMRGLVDSGYGVVLISHVGPLDDGKLNSDYHYLMGLMKEYNLNGPSICIAPNDLNSTQLKYLISNCRFFIGARTHSTIAAFSSCVPTLSIAYSVKALGINEDLFDDTNLVLDTRDVSLVTLLARFSLLEREEVRIKELLSERIPVWKSKSARPLDMLEKIF